MHLSAQRLAHMLMGTRQQAALTSCLGTTEAYAGTLLLKLASFAGGLGARCAPNGEREGRSPLAV